MFAKSKVSFTRIVPVKNAEQSEGPVVVTVQLYIPEMSGDPVIVKVPELKEPVTPGGKPETEALEAPFPTKQVILVIDDPLQTVCALVPTEEVIEME